MQFPFNLLVAALGQGVIVTFAMQLTKNVYLMQTLEPRQQSSEYLSCTLRNWSDDQPCRQPQRRNFAFSWWL